MEMENEVDVEMITEMEKEVEMEMEKEVDVEMEMKMEIKALGYREKVGILRQTKHEQTQEKIRRYKGKVAGYFDVDDKGDMCPPDDWKWGLTPNHPSGGVFGAKAWAENFYKILDTHPAYIDPYSSLAGGWMARIHTAIKCSWMPEHDYPELRLIHAKYDLIAGIGGAHHFHHDVENIGFKLGWKGILEKIRHYQAIHKDDAGKLEFLKAEELVVQGVQQWIVHNAQAARDMAAKEDSPDLKMNLERMAVMNFKLADEPPATFLEACQWLAWFLMEATMYNGSGAGGALDIILKPFFDKDIAEGRLTEDEAAYHLCCLLLKDTQYFEIGGTWPDGSDRTSRLSWCALEAAHWLKIPTGLCLRIHENIDRDFLRKSVEYLFEDKCANPSYLGDKCMVEGYMKNGYPAEVARTRYKTGCHWCALPGIEYTLNDTIEINLAKVFEVAYLEMAEGGGSGKVGGGGSGGESGCRSGDGGCSVARLWDLFNKHMGIAINNIKQSIDYHVEHCYLMQPELALNFMCHGPIERGLDISHGGVDNYNFAIDGAGLGTTADCFACLEQAVEREGVADWNEISEALETNWENREELRQYCKNIPRYGFGGTLADEYALRLKDSFVGHVKGTSTPKGFNCIPGLFSWANTIRLGSKVMATPNGRKAGTPITHGANPEPGFRESGALTAMGVAVASVQPAWGNTAPIQLEIDPALAKGGEAIDNIVSFLTTYCNDLGGTLVNINILDKEKLLAAYENPELYPDLVTRVTGFSVYFSTLSKEFKQMVIDRVIRDS